MRRELKARPKTQDSRPQEPEGRGTRGEESPSSIVCRPSSMGFTLTEVVIASTLLVIAIVPILKALTSAQVTSAIIERKTRSLIFAQGKLDEIKARSIYDYPSTFTETNTSIEGLYLCNVEDTSVNANLRQIKASVGEDLNDNSTLDADEIEVILVTLIAKRW